MNKVFLQFVFLFVLVVPFFTACEKDDPLAEKPNVEVPDKDDDNDDDDKPTETPTDFSGTVASFVSKYKDMSAVNLQAAFNGKTLTFTDTDGWNEDLDDILSRINVFSADDDDDPASEASGKHFKVKMPNLTGDIPDEAFEDCFGMTEFYAPKMAGNMGKDAFNGCEDHLTKITLGAVSSVDEGCFDGLTTRTCDLIFTAIPNKDIYYAKSDRNWGELGKKFKSITMPEETTDQEAVSYKGTAADFVSKYKGLSDLDVQAAFGGQTITFTDTDEWEDEVNVAAILSRVDFSDVNKQTGKRFKVQMPNLTGDIPDNAFYECWGMTEFYAPKMKGEWGSSAFYNCMMLTKITLGAVSEADKDSFTGMTCSSITLTFTAKPTVNGQHLDLSPYEREWPTDGRRWHKLIIED